MWNSWSGQAFFGAFLVSCLGTKVSGTAPSFSIPPSGATAWCWLSGNQGSRDGPLLFYRASTKTILKFESLFSFFNKKENNFCIVFIKLLSKGGQQNILKPTFDFLCAILYQIYIYILFSCLNLKPRDKTRRGPSREPWFPDSQHHAVVTRRVK
jgi:hypothetical protein